jgi:MFS family permease
MDNKIPIKLYSYRWIILFVYSFLALITQIQWLTFASVSEAAQEFYEASSLEIDFFSMIYMLVFIVMSIPASFIIDTRGLKWGLVFGAILTGVFSIMKALFASDYLMVCVAQTGLAVAQPFILNSITKMGAKWFPVTERATVVGIGTLAQYMGIVIALAFTPLLITKDLSGGYNINSMLWIYAIVSACGSLLLILLIKNEPPTPPAPADSVERINPLDGLKHIFSNLDMKFLLLLFFIGLGIFNAVSTCIDQITGKLSMEQTGIVGGVMLLGGIVGALIIPILSDKYRKRKPFLVLCMVFMIPGLAGLTFFEGFVPIMISAFVFGFFVMSAGPIGFQYGAEKSFPAPESTSQGIIMLTGQVSGILFVFGVNKLGIMVAMITFIVLTFLNVILSVKLKESYPG